MMVGEDDKERRSLTFSERECKVLLPEALQAEKCTKKFRAHVWHVLKNSIDHCSVYNVTYPTSNLIFNSDAEGKYWQWIHFCYVDTCPGMYLDGDGYLREREEVIEWLEHLIVRGEEHEVLTILESMLRFQGIPGYLADNIKECFKREPYSIDQSDVPVCIVRTTSKEMKESIKRSLDNINKFKWVEAKFYLSNASQALNNNNFADSILESIHAVEATVLRVDSKASEDFKTALGSLEKNGMIKHPALKEAFKKLHVYMNSEQGIRKCLRHPLFVGEVANVGFDEAIFMYGACVSFVDYLASKKKQMEAK